MFYKLTTYRLVSVIAFPIIRDEVFHEHWTFRRVVTPVVHFTAPTRQTFIKGEYQEFSKVEFHMLKLNQVFSLPIDAVHWITGA
jgi:hypothetical protein